MRAFRLAYDGRPFHGFQRQPDVPTVEGALFDALGSLGVYEPRGTPPSAPPGYAAAGRTDAGVSALAQTVAFEAPAWLTPRALDADLHGAVRAWASADVPEGFHATHDAARREYTYHLHAPTADDDRARAALDALCGRHDFHNLTPDATNTVRDLSGRLARDGDYLVVTLSAPGFARELVRRVVSLVRAVATGSAPRSKVDRVLAPEPLDGPGGVAPAPAFPLVLTAVDYPGVDFAVDEDAAAATRAAFEERRVEHSTAARAAATVARGLDE